MKTNTRMEHNDNNQFINNINCGDWELCIKSIIDESVDLVVTDPPYGMAFQSNHRKVKHKLIKNDAHLYIFCSWHNIDIFKSKISKYFNVKNILIWEKNNTGMGDLYGDYAPKYEMILFCSNGEKKQRRSQ